MMKKIAITFWVLLILAGCATHAGYEQRLNVWLGEDEAALVSQWGRPLKTYEANGFKYLVYKSSEVVTSTGVNPNAQTSFLGNSIYPGANAWAPSMNFINTCETIFEIQAGKVTSFDFKGPECRASSK
jgi:hypothetical protein